MDNTAYKAEESGAANPPADPPKEPLPPTTEPPPTDPPPMVPPPTGPPQGPLPTGPPPPAYPAYPAGQPTPYPQVQYAAYPQAGTATMVVAPAPLKFREAPMSMECPHCKTHITTNTSTKIGLLAWLGVGGVCLVGLMMPLVWLGCCFIPLCIPSLKDIIHTCPNCEKHLGTYNRLD